MNTHNLLADSRSHHTPNLEVWQPLDFTRLGSLPPPLARHTHTRPTHTPHTKIYTFLCVGFTMGGTPARNRFAVLNTVFFARCWNPSPVQLPESLTLEASLRMKQISAIISRVRLSNTQVMSRDDFESQQQRISPSFLPWFKSWTIP